MGAVCEIGRHNRVSNGGFGCCGVLCLDFHWQAGKGGKAQGKENKQVDKKHSRGPGDVQEEKTTRTCGHPSKHFEQH